MEITDDDVRNFRNMLANRLLILRIICGISREELCEILEMDIDVYATYEYGIANYKQCEVDKICEFYGADADIITMGGVNDFRRVLEEIMDEE